MGHSGGFQGIESHPLLSFQSSLCSVPGRALGGPTPAAGCMAATGQAKSEPVLEVEQCSVSLSLSYSHIEM